MRREPTLKEIFICWIEFTLLTALGMIGTVIAFAICAAITVGVVMSGMWVSDLFK
jgi:hypothetical protein